MVNAIDTILFDIGGTLRTSVKQNEDDKLKFIRQISESLGSRIPLSEFEELLAKRYAAYSNWARETYIELNEAGIWTQWIAPEIPHNWLSENAIKLNQLWRGYTGIRIPFPETKEVMLALFRRGYRLGIVSNTTSSVEVPALLKELNLSGCFETVILSCNFGKRKPDPAIMLEATRRMGVTPGQCAYVGDRADRDVVSSREAGISKVIIKDPQPELINMGYTEAQPDLYIPDLYPLLDLFPPLAEPRNLGPAYDASLSTMWAIKKFDTMPDFYLASKNMGFSGIEFNHQVNSSMLSELDLTQVQVSSIHEPCPADISANTLKEKDWLISSPNEECRQKGVDSIKRSIDLAARLGLRVIVVHCGQVAMDPALETRMRALFDSGLQDSAEYHDLLRENIKQRQCQAPVHMRALKQSLLELVDYAGVYDICLGLENRYHYFHMPSLDEMEELLALAEPTKLGFTYDIGHAQALDRLGFFPHEEWLHRFADRMVEIHIHDVKGVFDHLAPGLGEVDFDHIAPFLPEKIVRTLELHIINTPEQIKNGLAYLYSKGIIFKKERREESEK